ncbi:hypothetical protein [Gracilibacillus halophilus]|uniref:hypothetical protein n=1 Tax=Gracilibacillus halophilus TaxID=470864 RepID=UPI00039A71B7|nr:hypothetical protein [Gracilibacillus halophilus]
MFKMIAGLLFLLEGLILSVIGSKRERIIIKVGGFISLLIGIIFVIIGITSY